jgi:(4S)-4-hydroxy-5-phosphonooxypentane-2,3-dione isomerase
MQHIVIVRVHVKPEFVNGFIDASKENAKNSVKEPGIIRFYVVQKADDPTIFNLIEVYKTPDDQLKHRETDHYKIWKEKVEKMMAEPREGVKFINIFPE